jgi:hypothetical protein
MTGFDDVKVNVAARTVMVGAAVKMVQIRNALRPHGMQTEVTPEIGNATAGSVACCGTKDASITIAGLAQVSSTVIAVKMVNADGEVEAISEDVDPERLRLVRSSYGLLGVIFEVTFRIQPAIVLRHTYAAFPLNPTPSVDDLLGGADGMLALTLPYRRRILVERRYVAKDGRRISRFSRLKRFCRDKLWELAASYFATRLPYNWFFDLSDRLVELQLTALNWLGGFRAHRSDSTIDFKSGRSHYVDFTFWAIPVGRWQDFVPAYLAFCDEFRRETGFRASLLSEVYLMRRDLNSLLSPTLFEDAVTMDAVDSRINHPSWLEFNRRLNAIAASSGGRPLLNQTKELSREIVEQTLGADWARFVAIRQGEDPEGRFLSAFFRDLMPSSSPLVTAADHAVDS